MVKMVQIYTLPKFQSTRPVRDATKHLKQQSKCSRFQSTRPVRDATYNNIWIIL